MQHTTADETVNSISNGGPPSVALTPKTKLECIRSVLDRQDLTPAQKCVGCYLIVDADKEWTAVAKTADLQRAATDADRKTVFRATAKLDAEGIIAKASIRGQSGKYNILPPKIIEAVIEAYEEFKSSAAERVPISGPESGPLPTSNGVPFNGTTSNKAVPLNGTSATGGYQSSRARIVNPSGLVIPLENNINPPFSPPYEQPAVTFEKGRLKLFNGTKQFWLEKFGGDEEKLDLALAQAAGYVQPNSMKPLEAQVGAQLARMVRSKLDQDERYAKAAKTNKGEVAPGESRSARWGRMMAEIENEASKGSRK